MTAMQNTPTIYHRDQQGQAIDTARFNQLCADLQTRLTTVDGIISAAQADIAAGKLPDAVRSQLDTAISSVNDMSQRMLDLEQRMVDQVNKGKADADTVGGLLTRNADILTQAKAVQARKGKMQIDGIQARNIVTINGMGATAPLATAALPTLETTLALVDMINWAPVTSQLVPLLRESAYEIMADLVAEGAAKPESNIEFETVDLKISVAAHWIKISKQFLDDMPTLAAYIEGRLAYGVRLKLEALVINGTGPDTGFDGLLKVGNSIALVPTAGDTAIDTINRAKSRAYASGVPPQCILLNPEAWGAIERLKGDDGHYIFGSPGAMVQPVLWGLPVVLTAAMPVTKHWTGNITIGTAGFVRQDVAIELSTEDGDNFTKNLVTVRGEMRAAFGVQIPDAQVSGNLTAT